MKTDFSLVVVFDLKSSRSRVKIVSEIYFRYKVELCFEAGKVHCSVIFKITHVAGNCNESCLNREKKKENLK